jgi:hypothetical protein
VEANGVAPRAFGLVHGGVGPFQDVGVTGVVAGKQGHANAGGTAVSPFKKRADPW